MPPNAVYMGQWVTPKPHTHTSKKTMVGCYLYALFICTYIWWGLQLPQKIGNGETFALAKYISKSRGADWRSRDYLLEPHVDTTSNGFHFKYFTIHCFVDKRFQNIISKYTTKTGGNRRFWVPNRVYFFIVILWLLYYESNFIC